MIAICSRYPYDRCDQERGEAEQLPVECVRWQSMLPIGTQNPISIIVTSDCPLLHTYLPCTLGIPCCSTEMLVSTRAVYVWQCMRRSWSVEQHGGARLKILGSSRHSPSPSWRVGVAQATGYCIVWSKEYGERLAVFCHVHDLDIGPVNLAWVTYQLLAGAG